MLLGEKMCERAGLDPAEVFCNQFLLTRDSQETISGLNRISIRDWHFSFGPKLPICHAATPHSGIHVLVIGIAVDENGKVLEQNYLKSRLSRFRRVSSLERYLTHCAGRYVIIMLSDADERVYSDPSGMLGVVYNSETKSVGSSPFLVIKGRRLRTNTEYSLARAAGLNLGPRFAFGHTADAEVKRPLANHYLDLKTLEQHRHWPTADLDFCCPREESSYDAPLERFIDRHQQVIGALVDRFTPSHLPVSGGRDSRLLLGLAKPYLDKVTTTMVHVNNTHTKQDCFAAALLTKAVGRELMVLDASLPPVKIEDSTELERLQSIYRISSGHTPHAKAFSHEYISVAEATLDGGILMRGHVSDILKGVLWNKGVFEYTEKRPHVARKALRKLLLAGGVAKYQGYWKDEWYQQQYNKWYEGLPTNARPRVYDFLALEQFRSHGIGQSFYNFSRNFYISPGNDRSIIQAASCLPPDLRKDDAYFNRKVLERVAPELLDAPYIHEIKQLSGEDRNNALKKAMPKMRRSDKARSEYKLRFSESLNKN